MKIYTKSGDTGQTSLFGGERVSKSALRIDAYGTVDELNATIGLVLSICRSDNLCGMLEAIQRDLFVLGADLAAPMNIRNFNGDRIEERHTTRLEKEIDRMEEDLPPITYFILPGGCEVAARLHHSRTVCRRAERLVVELSEKIDINPNDVLYLNRLSDWFFVAARFANYLENVADTPWKQ